MTAEPLDPDDNLPETFTDDKLRDWFDAELEERRGKVLMMKLAGATFARIAAEVGVSMSTARKDYKIALAAQMQESPEVGIAKHRAIINDILRANYPAMLAGDKDAAQTILKALDRDSKLKGYDAPQRVLASITTRDFANEAAQLITRIQNLDPDALKELTRVHRPQRPIIDALPEPDDEGADYAEPLDVEAAPVAAPDGDRAELADDDDPAPLALADAVVVDRGSRARPPGGKGGDVYSALGGTLLGGEDDAGHRADDGRRDDGAEGLDSGAPERHGERRQQPATDGVAEDPAPEPDDLDGWSNIEDD